MHNGSNIELDTINHKLQCNKRPLPPLPNKVQHCPSGVSPFLSCITETGPVRLLSTNTLANAADNILGKCNKSNSLIEFMLRERLLQKMAQRRATRCNTTNTTIKRVQFEGTHPQLTETTKIVANSPQFLGSITTSADTQDDSFASRDTTGAEQQRSSAAWPEDLVKRIKQAIQMTCNRPRATNLQFELSNKAAKHSADSAHVYGGLSIISWPCIESTRTKRSLQQK